MNDDYIDTREGWREVPLNTFTRYVGESRLVFADGNNNDRYWVREELVPPLPTVPYTVIRAKWDASSFRATSELAFFGGDWIDVDGEAFSPKELRKRIVGFEVLSEPRAVIAKAVIKRVRELDGNEIDPTEVWDGLAREFGVEP